jgi:hypothetical protein
MSTNTEAIPDTPTPPTGARPTSIAEIREHEKRMPFDKIDEGVRSFKTRPTDIIVATFPKSGTTWMQQIVHGLRTRGSMDFEEIHMVVPFIDFSHIHGVDLDAPQVAEPRAFKTHLPWGRAPKGARYIYVVRDPGDALVSAYHFMNGVMFERDSIDVNTFGQELFLAEGATFGTYWSHLLSWWPQRTRDDVLFCCFEEMKRDLPGTVRRVARFMGIEADPELLDIATRQASFEFMLQHVTKFDEHPFQQAMDRIKGVPPGKPLSKVRTGRVGDRMSELSEATREALDATWKREIEATMGFPSYDHLRAHIAAMP